ncbi:MAG: ATP-binding cassette domain-containing protein, partial [Pseudomonadota bacterium]
MLDSSEGYVTEDGRKIGGVVMEMKNITLRFGGVVAIRDISFDIREGEIRAIIGPNGAGKSSMLNVISGFYVPQEGEVWFHGAKRPPMRPFEVAQQGIARTFQNIALFDGMSVLDNIMTGRLNHMKANFLDQMIWWGKAEREEVANREKAEEIIDFLDIQAIRKTPVGRLPYGLKKRVELARALV